MKLVLIPLDERAINMMFPSRIAEIGGLAALTPPTALMPKHRNEADIAGLMEWVEKNIADATHLIISSETLFWGGLIPSRINQRRIEEALESLRWLEALKHKHPELYVALFSVITRTSKDASKDEEPQYWIRWKEEFLKLGELFDRLDQTSDPNRANELKREIAVIERNIPREYLDDYIRRRKRNLSLQAELISAVARGAIDYLVISRDDTSGFGFISYEERALKKLKDSLKLGSEKVTFLSGADELTCVLVGRTLIQNISRPLVYFDWLNPESKDILGFYDGKPLVEVFKLEVELLGMKETSSADAADLIIAIANPTQPQVDQWIDPLVDRDGNRRNMIETPDYDRLEEQLSRLATYKSQGKLVGFADVFAVNGAQSEILKYIAPLVGSNIDAYAAINTAANTAGIVAANLAALWRALQLNLDIRYANNRFNAERLLDDGVYQGITRMRLKELLADTYDIYNPTPLPERILKNVTEEIRQDAEAILREAPLYRQMKSFRAWFPWEERLFTVDLEAEMI
jgi:hypothetical protein